MIEQCGYLVPFPRLGRDVRGSQKSVQKGVGCNSVTIEAHERKHTGEIIYILPASKIVPSRKSLSKGYHTISGKAYTNDASARYLVDCHDGFPHLINQSQVTQEKLNTELLPQER